MLPFARFRTPAGDLVDTVLGPEMKSTGEVMGIDDVFGTAFAKSQAAAYGSLPTKGTVFVSVANRDKRAMIFPVKRLADLGFEILATAGTAQVLRRNGVRGRGRRQGQRGPATTSSSRILAGEVDLVMNTPCGVVRAAAGRVRDPHRGGRRRHPVPDHGAGRGGRGAGHRGAGAGRGRRALAAGPASPDRRRWRGRVTRPSDADRCRCRSRPRSSRCSGIGEYVLFTVVAPRIAQRARPGQFLTVGGRRPDTSMPLRRAFAIYDATPGDEFAGTVQFVVAAHGRGTRGCSSSRPAHGSIWSARSASASRCRRRRGRPCWSAAATAARR